MSLATLISTKQLSQEESLVHKTITSHFLIVMNSLLQQMRKLNVAVLSMTSSQVLLSMLIDDHGLINCPKYKLSCHPILRITSKLELIQASKRQFKSNFVSTFLKPRSLPDLVTGLLTSPSPRIWDLTTDLEVVKLPWKWWYQNWSPLAHYGNSYTHKRNWHSLTICYQNCYTYDIHHLCNQSGKMFTTFQ